MWTGVWESPKLADGTNRDSDIELDTGANLRDNVPAPTWMVSTPDSFTKNDIQSDLANLTALYTSATERATLLEYTDSTGNATSVEVPKITFDDGSRGYAYWVADEGVKTRIDRPHKDGFAVGRYGRHPHLTNRPPRSSDGRKASNREVRQSPARAVRDRCASPALANCCAGVPASKSRYVETQLSATRPDRSRRQRASSSHRP